MTQKENQKEQKQKREFKIKMRDYQSFMTKMVLVSLLVLFQIAFFIVLLFGLSSYQFYINGFLTIVSLLVVIFIINKHDNPGYKLAWIVPILCFPIVGGPLYLLMAGNRTRKKFMKTINSIIDDSSDKYIETNETIHRRLEKIDKVAAKEARYINDNARYSLWDNTQTTYFPEGVSYYDSLMDDLKSAKKFIFLEYFIIKQGMFWNDVLQVLVDKVNEGVDVRLIFDDVGSMTSIPPKFVQMMEHVGIKCVAFNRFTAAVNLRQNNRDHRKIAVIDGNIGYTGGINLADEYIHIRKPFGYWKDTGIRLEGPGVWNFTVMFLQMWEFLNPSEKPYDYNIYRPTLEKKDLKENGFVQPYSDAPVDEEFVGENIYLNIINQAKDYVYIMTPYLVIDNEILTALTLAAKSGVDVRIITPGIPDKKTVFIMTKSFYRPLIEAGVKIYSFTPGFVHAKVFLSDDQYATVGSVNLDYRSLFLHFECGVWMYQTDAIMPIKDDFFDTMKKSHQVSLEECKKEKSLIGLYQSLLKLFAPLM